MICKVKCNYFNRISTLCEIPGPGLFSFQALHTAAASGIIPESARGAESFEAYDLVLAARPILVRGRQTFLRRKNIEPFTQCDIVAIPPPQDRQQLPPL